MGKPQRIRDPLHNLIEFDTSEFEKVMWNVLQTRPFQRLRRVKQLGFSDLVYPGATHSRFAHSVGVFHLARQLMKIIQRHLGSDFEQTKAQTALAAALVHDLGHGPFSHSFEDVGRRLNLKLANHELVSELLIKDGEVGETLKTLGSGFANDVSSVIKSRGVWSIYNAVVSSQFDADRLDYMQRDKLMTGTQHGAIDFKWLIGNLQVGKVPYGVDEKSLTELDTFVLGPKAIYAAEAYILGLFQLYPTVYFHKATRGAEKIFTELMVRVIKLVQEDHVAKTGIAKGHPIERFATDPDKLEHVLELDDSVILGALSQFASAKDPVISKLASRLRDRQLYKSQNLREQIGHKLATISSVEDGEFTQLIDAGCVKIKERILEWKEQKENNEARILYDQEERAPYKKFQESKGPLNQVRIKTTNGELVDLVARSKVVRAIEPFKLFRVYHEESDEEVVKFIKDEIGRVCDELSKKGKSRSVKAKKRTKK
ncbi:MAG: HD domain-containing protein [Rhodospirillaceae bacterium]|nr:HD domain-containing protein [Rhodospirillaceae bacterium]